MLAVLTVASSQYLSGGLRGPKQMSDSALHKILSVIRGGGRGHRELVAMTSSGSNPPASLQSAPSAPSGGGGGLTAPPPSAPSSGLASLFGFGRAPQSINHVPPPPKIGTFYITPPERNAPYFYGAPPSARRPHSLFKFGGRNPLAFITAESSNRPGPHSPFGQFPFVSFNGPFSAAASTLPQTSAAQASTGASAPTASAAAAPPSAAQGNDAASVQEIVTKAAQQQHNNILQKEQKAHPNAQINSQLLVPSVGQQPVFINQFGQPFLAPALFAGSAGQQGPPPPQGPGPQGPPPPQFLANPGMVLLTTGPAPSGPSGFPPQGRFPQNFPPHGNLVGEIPEQFLKPQQGPQTQPQHQPPPQFQLINQGIPPPHQGQRYPIPLSAQQIPGGAQLLSLPPGAPHILPGQFAILPQNSGSVGVGGIRNVPGALVPGNAILGQPHFAIVGGPAAGVQISDKPVPTVNIVKSVQMEQPKRPVEASSDIVATVVPASKSTGAGQMTAAIMQSQVEYSEPIVKQ